MITCLTYDEKTIEKYVGPCQLKATSDPKFRAVTFDHFD